MTLWPNDRYKYENSSKSRGDHLLICIYHALSEEFFEMKTAFFDESKYINDNN